MEAVAAERRALPQGGIVSEDYVFDGLGCGGKCSEGEALRTFRAGQGLADYLQLHVSALSQGRPAGPRRRHDRRLERKDSPCPSCTAFLDSLAGVAKHIEAAGFNFVVIASAPLDQLNDFAKDRGLENLRLLSSAGNSFKHEYHAETPDGHQMPMMTVFHRKGKTIRHFWSSEMFWTDPDPRQDPRHNGTIEPLWNIFDLTPKAGRRDGKNSCNMSDGAEPLTK